MAVPLSADKNADLLAAGAIAKELDVRPKATRGVCNLYGRDVLAKVKTAAK